MLRNLFRLCALVVWVFSLVVNSRLFFCAPAFAAETSAVASPSTLQAAIRAWEERTKKYRSIRIAWNEDFYDPGVDVEAKDGTFRLNPSQTNPSASGLSSGKVSYVSHIKVALDGEKMRYELVRESLEGNNKLTDQPYFATYNGEVSKSLFGKGKSGAHPVGHVVNIKQCEAVSQLDTLPVRMEYATLLPKISEIKIDELKVSPQEGVIGDHPCIIFESKVEAPMDSSVYLWVNPAKGYSIERYELRFGGKVRSQVDMSYEFKGEWGWQLSQWTTSRFGSDDSLTTYSKSFVTKQEVNPNFVSDEFDIVFPVGTVVSDSRPIHAGKIGRTGTFDYVVKENGEIREITWGERFANYEEIMASNTGEAIRPKNASHDDDRNWTWILVTAFVLIVLLLWRIRYTRFVRDYAKSVWIPRNT